MLTGIDGDLKGKGDACRMRIWTEANGTETTVYDNRMGDAQDVDAATALGAGSIIIHKK